MSLEHEQFFGENWAVIFTGEFNPVLPMCLVRRDISRRQHKTDASLSIERA